MKSERERRMSMRQIQVCFFVMFSMVFSQAHANVMLKEHEDRHRVLLIYVKGEEGLQQLSVQEQEFRKDEWGMKRRDLVEYVLRDRFSDSIIKKHAMKGPFMIVLLGKDGEEKLRSKTPVSIQSLFEIIDAMPMRKREIRERRAFGG